MNKRINFKLILIALIFVLTAIGSFFVGQNVKISKLEKHKNDEYVSENFDLFDKNSDATALYPFELYNSFLMNSSESIVNELNNNPIDNKYQVQYTKANSLGEEKEILANWSDAYEKEFANAKKVFENSVKDKGNDYLDSDVLSEDLILKLNEYYNDCFDYVDSTANFSYDFEEYILGNGSNHSYDLLLNSLKLNRINTLRIIECIYLMNENYIWLNKCS